jgi:hypothetical protein
MALREYIPEPLRAFRSRVFDRLSLRPGSIGISYDPHDRAVREDLAERLFQAHEKEQPVGTIGRSRLILKIMEEGFPTSNLVGEYFHNLKQLLKTKERRTVPGQVVLGLGPGRSGSTSLAALLATVKNSRCTHENPPLIFWTPDDVQVQFHIRRFKFLAEYFSLVADVSHWWLNALDGFFEQFPDIKVVGMLRDVDECAKSFMIIKRFGWGSWNHWVPYGNGIWASHSWDPTYPTYAVPDKSSKKPDSAKYELIARYVREYNAQLASLAARLPKQIMLVRTKDLSDPAIQIRIFDFAGVSGRVSKSKLNVHSVTDGMGENLRF